MNVINQIQRSSQVAPANGNQQLSLPQTQSATSKLRASIHSLGQRVLHRIKSGTNAVARALGRSVYPLTVRSQGGESSGMTTSNSTYIIGDTVLFSEKKLQNWVTYGGIKSNLRNRQEAANRIKEAYASKSTKLILIELNLTSLPAEIGALTTLELLDLSHNQLESLPSEISALVALRALNLGDNQLNFLPSEIGTLVALKELYLTNNKLKTLPLEIGALVSLQNLYLSNNQLKFLPSVIGALVALKYLSLSNNQLEFLPSEIGALVALQMFFLTNNQLKTLPSEIGALVALKGLYLSNNKLQTLPSEIGALAALKGLFLGNNQLRFLPSEIGALAALEWLFLIDNQNLNELPMSLGQIPGLTYLNYNNQNLRRIADAILEQCQEVRKGEALKTLPKRLVTWKIIANIEEDLSRNIDGLSDCQKRDLNEWLVRLERTRDFSSNQETLAKTVCGLILDVVKNEEFRDLFFTQVAANNECCEDRAAMALNEIHSAWKILCLSPDASIKEKLNILTGVAKTLALRNRIAARIDKQQKTNKGYIERESVEIYLYYETSLKNNLQLQNAIEGMAHEDIGKRDWINEKDLEKEVNETFFDFLYDIPVFVEILKKEDSKIAAEFQNLNEICTKQIGDPPIEDELSDLFIDWNIKTYKFYEELKASKLKIARKWYNANVCRCVGSVLKNEE